MASSTKFTYSNRRDKSKSLAQKELSSPSEIFKTPKNKSKGWFDFVPAGEPKSGAHGSVLQVHHTESNQMYAIKTQVIFNPKDVNEKAYRELLVLERINKLQKEQSEKYNLNNFVKLENKFGFATEDVTIPKSKKSNNSNNNTSKPKTPKRPVSEKHYKYMNFVMEFVEDSLTKHTSLSLMEYKCILFQLIYALHQAQVSCQFVHNDLHLGNILLKDQAADVVHIYTLDKMNWYIKGPTVRIVDFGLSRCTLEDGEVVYNTKVPWSWHFDSSVDINKLAEEFSSKLKIVDWESRTTKNNDEVDGNNNSTGDDNNDDGDDDDDDDGDDEIQRMKSLKKDILAKMKRGVKPLKLLLHPFFEDLQQKPVDNSATIVQGPISPMKRPKQVKDMSLYEKENQLSSTQLTPVEKLRIHQKKHLADVSPICRTIDYNTPKIVNSEQPRRSTRVKAKQVSKDAITVKPMRIPELCTEAVDEAPLTNAAICDKKNENRDDATIVKLNTTMPATPFKTPKPKKKEKGVNKENAKLLDTKTIAQTPGSFKRQTKHNDTPYGTKTTCKSIKKTTSANNKQETKKYKKEQQAPARRSSRLATPSTKKIAISRKTKIKAT